MTVHTMGPWSIRFAQPDVPYQIDGASGERVLRWGAFIKPTEPRALANAHLIAAAPTLLAELKHLVRLMEAKEQTGLDIPGLATLNGARAVIAKAEGR
jgi:hypothetical protein